MVTVHLLIKGKVQGVFFRATAKDIALALELKGWVKNTGEGDVEAMASGAENAINQFIEWCKQGPSGAIVTSVEVNHSPDKNFDGFQIKRG